VFTGTLGWTALGRQRRMQTFRGWSFLVVWGEGDTGEVGIGKEGVDQTMGARFAPSANAVSPVEDGREVVRG